MYSNSKQWFTLQAAYTRFTASQLTFRAGRRADECASVLNRCLNTPLWEKEANFVILAFCTQLVQCPILLALGLIHISIFNTKGLGMAKLQNKPSLLQLKSDVVIGMFRKGNVFHDTESHF